LKSLAWKPETYNISKALFLGAAESYIFRESSDLQEEQAADDVERANHLFTLLLKNIANVEERAQVHQLKILLKEKHSEYEAAVEIGLECLKSFGYDPKSEEEMLSLGEIFTFARAKIKNSFYDLVEAPENMDPNLLALSDILLSVVSAAYYTDHTLLVTLVCKLAKISIEKGPSIHTVAAFAWLGK
jgi:hypothetical protein